MGDVFDDLIDRQGSPADAARVAADLETGGGAEMPVMQERSICAPSYDQAHAGTGDHTLCLGSSRGRRPAIDSPPLTVMISESSSHGALMEGRGKICGAATPDSAVDQNTIAVDGK
jgi:hypothetical protein